MRSRFLKSSGYARIEVKGLGAQVYFNDMTKPVLVVADLKRGYSRGSVGLWGGATGGHFSNFTYKVESPGAHAERATPPMQAGIIAKWELSDAFDVAQRDT